MSDELQVPSSRCPGFFRWAVGLIAFVSVLVMAENVNASCGDYLHGLNRTSVVAEHPSGEELPAHDSLPSVPVCNGPFCEQAPFLPINRPPSSTQTITDKELHVWEKICVVITDEWYCLERDRRVLPNPPDADRLDRPPRL